MDKEIIVFVGGPSSGKTTLINALKNAGHICYPEISREIIKDAQKQGIDQLFLKEPLYFSKLLLQGRIKQYQDALREKASIVFLDRGIPDVLAYMNYIGDAYPKSFSRTCKDYKYTKVFILPPWEAIYTSDEERYENYEQALLIYNHLKETYSYFGYNLIEIPKDSIENRVAFVTEQISI